MSNTKRLRLNSDSILREQMERSGSVQLDGLIDALGDPIEEASTKARMLQSRVQNESNYRDFSDLDTAVPRAATDDLSSSVFLLGFEIDPNGLREPSWQQSNPMASSVLNTLVEPIRSLSRQLSRTRQDPPPENNEESEIKNPPRPRPTLIRQPSAMSRSTTELLREAIGSFGGSNRSIVASPPPTPEKKPPSPKPRPTLQRKASSFTSRSTSDLLRRAIGSFGGSNRNIMESSPAILANNFTDNDVLCDLDSYAIHNGNKAFRSIMIQACKSHRGRAVSEKTKEQIAVGVVNWTLQNGGRFLKLDNSNNWTVVSQDEALQMTLHHVTLEIDLFPPSVVVQLPHPPTRELPSRGGSFGSLFGGLSPKTTHDAIFDLPPAKRAKIDTTASPGILNSFFRGAVDEVTRILSNEGETVLEKDISKKDILCGRGGKSNHHDGNKWYREIIAKTRPVYHNDSLSKKEKTDISNGVVDYIQNNGGRFLKPSASKTWVVMSHADARRKAAQLLRESKTLKWTG